MDNIFVAILSLGLATWRLSSLIVAEDGPFGILAKFRSIVGIRYNELSEPVGTNTIADLLTCVWCASVWIGLLFAVIWYINANFAVLISFPLALSAVAIIVEKIVHEE